jgi:hypothetical protein
MRSNRQALVQLCGKLLRERKVCTSDILAFASSHDQPRSGPNNSERESTSARSTNYGSGHLIQVFRDIGRIFSLLFLLSHLSPIGHPTRGRVQKRKRNVVSSKAKNGFNRVSCGTQRRWTSQTACHSQNENPAREGKGGVSGNPHVRVFGGGGWRALLGKHMGAPEVPHGTSGTNNTVGHSLLKISDHLCFAAGDRDCQRLARSRSELDNVGPVVFRAVDHHTVLAAHRRFFLPYSSSSSRFTAGASAFFILSQSGERPDRGQACRHGQRQSGRRPQYAR